MPSARHDLPALLATATLVLGGGLSALPARAATAGQAPATSSTSTSSGRTATVSVLQAPDALAGRRHPPLHSGQRFASVAVPGGIQAAVYDNAGHVVFWSLRLPAGRWTRVGSSAYPVLPTTPPRVQRATGFVLAGMHSAVFVLHGAFTGDGGANYIAYGTGPHGWGQLLARGSTLVPTESYPTVAGSPGLALRIQVSHGFLEISQSADVVTVAQSALLPVNRFYRWTGSHLTLHHDNVLDATASRPPSAAPAIGAARHCPGPAASGVYDAPENAMADDPGRSFAFDTGVDVTVMLFARNDRVCRYTVPAAFRISIPMTTTAGRTRWITAPIWVLTTSGSLGNPWDDLQGTTESPAVRLGSFRPRGAAPWFIPRSLHVKALAPVGVESPVASAVVQVRLRRGHLTGLTVFRNSLASD